MPTSAIYCLETNKQRHVIPATIPPPFLQSEKHYKIQLPSSGLEAPCEQAKEISRPTGTKELDETWNWASNLCKANDQDKSLF